MFIQGMMFFLQIWLSFEKDLDIKIMNRKRMGEKMSNADNDLYTMDGLLLDQASTLGSKSGVGACYTPWGMRQMDTEICKRIGKIKNTKDLLDLEREIQNNPHLHIKLRQNYIINMNTHIKYLEENNLIED